MQLKEILILIVTNMMILGVFLIFQKRLLKKQINNLKKEISELENLVSAIIEEFEEVIEKSKVERVKEEEPVEKPAKEVDNSYLKLEIDNTNDNNYVPEEDSEPAVVEEGPLKQQLSSEANREVFGNDKQKRIIQLAKEGHAVEVIAKTLNLGCGEVRLVLDIYQKNK